MKKTLEEIKNTEFKVDNEYSHISIDEYRSMSIEEKKKIPINILKQIQQKDNVKQIIKYDKKYKFTKHLSISIWLIVIILIKIPFIIPITFAIFGVISTILCIRYYHLLDAELFAYVTMLKFFKKVNL